MVKKSKQRTCKNEGMGACNLKIRICSPRTFRGNHHRARSDGVESAVCAEVGFVNCSLFIKGSGARNEAVEPLSWPKVTLAEPVVCGGGGRVVLQRGVAGGRAG